MTTTVPRKLTAARVSELKEASSLGASAAFEQFAGATLVADKPVLRDVAEPLQPELWRTGIFFEFHGELAGNIAILLSRPTCDAVAGVLEGVMNGAPNAEARDSIVLELGNVVASQIVSTIADRLSGRIVLSIPHMVADGAERELAWRVRHGALPGAEAGLARIDTEFVDAPGRLRALVVLVPDLSNEDAHPAEAFDNVES